MKNQVEACTALDVDADWFCSVIADSSARAGQIASLLCTVSMGNSMLIMWDHLILNPLGVFIIISHDGER